MVQLIKKFSVRSVSKLDLLTDYQKQRTFGGKRDDCGFGNMCFHGEVCTKGFEFGTCQNLYNPSIGSYVCDCYRS